MDLDGTDNVIYAGQWSKLTIKTLVRRPIALVLSPDSRLRPYHSTASPIWGLQNRVKSHRAIIDHPHCPIPDQSDPIVRLNPRWGFAHHDSRRIRSATAPNLPDRSATSLDPAKASARSPISQTGAPRLQTSQTGVRRLLPSRFRLHRVPCFLARWPTFTIELMNPWTSMDDYRA
jgi:hypothetical protein